MEHLFNHEQLPSGKIVMRQFSEDGGLVDETHSYLPLTIGIRFTFRAGIKIEETYFSKGRMVSRRTYEKARTKYKDMPVADSSIEDWGAELLRMAGRKRRERSAQAKQRRPNAEEAREYDAFCSSVMAEGKREDAVQWIQTKSHTLGVKDWSSSKRLVERLSALGCVQIYACEIDNYGGSDENTGHMIVELPKQKEARKKILKMIDRLATETGYNGPFDDGQRFAYVKLD